MRVLQVLLVCVVSSLSIPAVASGGSGQFVFMRAGSALSIIGGSEAGVRRVDDSVSFDTYGLGLLTSESEGSATNRWFISEEESAEVVSSGSQRTLEIDTSHSSPLYRAARLVTGDTLPRGVGVADSGCSVTVNARLCPSDDINLETPENALFSVFPFYNEDADPVVTNFVAIASDGINRVRFVLVPGQGLESEVEIVVHMIPTVMKSGSKLPGFYVTVDGSPLTFEGGSTCTSDFLSEHADEIRDDCLTDIRSGTLFLSVCGTDRPSYVGTALSGCMTLNRLRVSNTPNSYVCHIGENSYVSLAKAVAAKLTASDTIALDADVTEDIVIPAGRTLTLDLNGHVLCGTGAGSVLTQTNSVSYVTVTDSSEGESRQLHYFDIDANGLWVWNDDAHETESCVAGGCITGGRALSGGGGINNSRYNSNKGVTWKGTLTLSNIGIVGNAAKMGGGVYSNAGEIEMTNCLFFGNVAVSGGGGVYALGEKGGSLKAFSTSFSQNSAGTNTTAFAQAGALYLTMPTSLTQCGFDRNVVVSKSGMGGAVRAHTGCALSLDACDFVRNTAARGSALYTSATNALTFRSTRILNNVTTGTSGAVHLGTKGIAMSVSGETTTADNDGGNLYFGASNLVTVASDFTGRIGVSSATKPTDATFVPVTEACAASAYWNFTSDDSSYRLVYRNGAVALATSGSSSCTRIADNVWATSENGVCTIYGSGDMANASEWTSGNPLAALARGTTSLVIEDGVTSIGSQAFCKFTDLETVTVPASVTNVAAYAFYRCNSLTTMNFAALPTFGEKAYTMQAAIYMKDGIPTVYTIPQIVIAGYTQRLMGKAELTDPDWTDVTDLSDDERKTYHFFKIELKK